MINEWMSERIKLNKELQVILFLKWSFATPTVLKYDFFFTQCVCGAKNQENTNKLSQFTCISKPFSFYNGPVHEWQKI